MLEITKRTKGPNYERKQLKFSNKNETNNANMTKITVFSYNKLQAAFSIIIITTSIAKVNEIHPTMYRVPSTDHQVPSTELYSY